MTLLEINNLRVEMIRKNIKNLRLAVYPPDGRIRVTAPMETDDDVIQLFVISKLPWVRKQQKRFLEQDRQSNREMVSGESVYYLGRRYRLRVTEQSGNPKVRIKPRSLELRVPPGSDVGYRNRVLANWYRRELRSRLPELIEKWEPVIGVKVLECKIKQMRTKWGTCNAKAGRIWLNLELIKKPPQCLEYVLIHEMIHLLYRHHDEHFKALMNRCYPLWQSTRDELNQFILKDEQWNY